MRAKAAVREPVRRARPLLGTLVEITIPGADEAAFAAAFDAISRVHGLMSFHETGSDLDRLRKARPGSTIEVAPETMRVLRTAMDLHERSGGLFDVTIGRKLVRYGYLPREGLVHLNRFSGTMADIHLSGDSQVQQDRIPLIDLGGIAKGFAVDCAVDALLAAGISDGLVNAGGDLRVFGEEGQSIHLRRGDGQLLDLGMVRNHAIASSENRQSRRKWQGMTTTPHINGHGEPILIDQLVSVAADSCMIADAMTKVAAIAPDVAERMLAAHNGAVLYHALAG